MRSDDGTSRIKQHETDFRHSSHRRGDGRLGFTRVGGDAALAVGHDRGAGTEDRIRCRFHVSRFRWGQSAELSRKAKADYIFKMMNKLHWEGGRWSGILNFLSRQVFYDDPKYFCKGDDFANFLLQPESWQLDDPLHLLMIPYSQLLSPPTRNHQRKHLISVGGYKGGNRTIARTVIETVPDYLAEVPEDRNPGFLQWLQLNMPDVLSRVVSITDQTDSTFIW